MLLSGDRARDARAARAPCSTATRPSWTSTGASCALIEPLRTLRMIHHSAWIARRWNDPAFPIAFPWFGSPAYWAEQTTQLREQLDAMAEPPLGSAA